MAHMKPDVQRFTAYHVDTNGGEEVVPEAVCGTLNLDENGMPDDVRKLLPYCEHPRIAGVERKSGWYVRLSAPGYLDCTPWDGPHATRDAALASLLETFEIDADGEDLSEGPCSERAP